jgi:HlyD family secretion protein
MATKVETTRDIQLPTPGVLSRLVASIKHHRKMLAIMTLIVAAVIAYMWWRRGDSAGSYTTEQITRGTVEVDVSATGTLQAVTTVQVGSQVSGTVAWLGADFKSRVKRGQVIAKLDPALFQAQVDTARANLLNAQAGVQAALTDINNQKANVQAAQANDLANQAQRDDAASLAKRDEQLRGIIADRDIEASENQARAAAARYGQAASQTGQAQAQVQTSQAKLKQAQAAVEQAQAQLAQANINLQHSVITSPIDGVVVSRSVDVGQTVAASLQAPTLFVIANDLTNMQVLGSIDEADVGQVREGGKATFTVDAYPGQTFTGDINQLRLNSQTQQNVVTYTAVINVSNPDEKLMPGMTANITIPVAKRENVLRVPNAALRFKPSLSGQQQKQSQARTNAPGQQSNQGATRNPAAGAAGDSGNQRQSQTIWLLNANRQLESRVVRIGITDGRVTEIISGDVQEGDAVVIGQTQSGGGSSQKPATPFGQQPTGGGAGGPRIR